MEKKTDYILRTLKVVSWIIFVGVCIEAGGFIINTFVTLLSSSADASKFWIGVNLSELYSYSQSHFITMIFLMIVVAAMRALMFYFIVKVFHDKKFNLSLPYNETVRRFIWNIAYLALGIGLFSFLGTKYVEELMTQGVNMPQIQYLRIGGADVWLFMGVALLVIAQIFKKGIEIQNENDLTI